MPKSSNGKNRIRRLFTTLFIISAVLLILACFSFEQISGFLGQFEADGQFDSLTAAEYQSLRLALAILGVFLAGCGGLFIVFRDRLENRFERISSIHLRNDLANLRRSIYAGKDDRPFLYTLAAITLIAALIRWIQLMRPVGYDEAYTYVYFASRPLRYIITDYSGPNNHIWHTILVHYSTLLFGNSLVSLRLPAFLGGILLGPAGYLAGKSLYNRWSGLLSAAALAWWPMLVDYSVNARGYTLVCLAGALGLWLAAEVRQTNTFGSWLLLYITCALGMYTIPTFLYPFGVIFLWLFLSALAGETGGLSRKAYLLRWFGWGIATGLTTLLLYMPIIVLGTGLNSLIGNEFVQSVPYSELAESVLGRMPKVWSEWMVTVPDWLVWGVEIGFIASLILHWRKSNHRLPVVLAGILWIAAAILIQRVVPLARVWMFLLVYVLIWSAAGWVKLFEELVTRVRIPAWAPALGLVGIIALTVWGYAGDLRNPELQVTGKGFDYAAAEYLDANLQPGDKILAVAPGSIRVGYYLLQMDVPYSRFYDRARPEPVQSGYIVILDRSKYPTPEAILTFLHLEDKIDPAAATLVFEQKKMQVYRLGE